MNTVPPNEDRSDPLELDFELLQLESQLRSCRPVSVTLDTIAMTSHASSTTPSSIGLVPWLMTWSSGVVVGVAATLAIVMLSASPTDRSPLVSQAERSPSKPIPIASERAFHPNSTLVKQKLPSEIDRSIQAILQLGPTYSSWDRHPLLASSLMPTQSGIHALDSTHEVLSSDGLRTQRLPQNHESFDSPSTRTHLQQELLDLLTRSVH
ncbi:MAG: hypothetical protein U0905_03915 [Pirellulales bacterium]